MNHEAKVELINFMTERNIELSDVVDVVIESNGLIGVGLITLADDLKAYVLKKAVLPGCPHES